MRGRHLPAVIPLAEGQGFPAMMKGRFPKRQKVALKVQLGSFPVHVILSQRIRHKHLCECVFMCV